MPTYAWTASFSRDWVKLSRERQAQFLLAVGQLVEDLAGGGQIRKGLRVKKVRGHPGVCEMTWADDGRATWQYGPERRAGHAHVVWRRIGSHDIFDSP